MALNRKTFKNSKLYVYPSQLLIPLEALHGQYP